VAAEGADDERSPFRTEGGPAARAEEGVPPPPAPAPSHDMSREGAAPVETAAVALRQPNNAGGAAGWTVHVKTMMGAQWPLEVRPDEPTEEMRATLWAVSGTMPDQQKLVWATESGDVIIGHDDRSVRDYGIQDGDTLTLVAQKESVGQQGRADAERERQAKLEAKRRAEEKAVGRPQRARYFLWAGIHAAIQIGAWSRDPDVALACAIVAAVLLLVGASLFGFTERNPGLGDCLGSSKRLAIHLPPREERGFKQGFFAWEPADFDPCFVNGCLGFCARDEALSSLRSTLLRTTFLGSTVVAGAIGLLLVVLEAGQNCLVVPQPCVPSMFVCGYGQHFVDFECVDCIEADDFSAGGSSGGPSDFWSRSFIERVSARDFKWFSCDAAPLWALLPFVLHPGLWLALMGVWLLVFVPPYCLIATIDNSDLLTFFRFLCGREDRCCDRDPAECARCEGCKDSDGLWCDSDDDCCECCGSDDECCELRTGCDD